MAIDDKYRHTRTTVSLINYHFVWTPRRRRKVLINGIDARLKQLLHEKAEELGCKILALEVMPDHVHLFISCPPKLAPDQVMFRLKGYSSRVLRFIVSFLNENALNLDKKLRKFPRRELFPARLLKSTLPITRQETDCP